MLECVLSMLLPVHLIVLSMEWLLKFIASIIRNKSLAKILIQIRLPIGSCSIAKGITSQELHGFFVLAL